jgi:O-antigen/teichoic acid export membrane protein
VGNRVYAAYQEAFVSGLWAVAALVVGLVATLAAVQHRAPLPTLLVAVTVPPLLVTAVNCLVLFGWQRRQLRPSLRTFRKSTARELLSSGMLFLVLQLAFGVAYASDNVIAARVTTVEQVTLLAVVAKPFSLLATLLGFALTPLWPAYGEAVARGDHRWATRMFCRSLLGVAALATLGSALLVPLGPRLLAWWVGRAVDPTTGLLVSQAVWTICLAVGSTMGVFMNGINLLRPQMALALVATVLAPAAKTWMVGRWGLVGIGWGNVLAWLVVSTPLALMLARHLRALGETSGRDAPSARRPDVAAV